MRLALCALCATLVLPVATPAQERETLGVGRIFTNDALGDGKDRWRSGSYAVSILRGEAWDGAPPVRPGELIEYRFRTEVVYPGRMGGTGSDDRPFAGVLGLAAQTHWSAL